MSYLALGDIILTLFESSYDPDKTEFLEGDSCARPSTTAHLREIFLKSRRTSLLGFIPDSAS